MSFETFQLKALPIYPFVWILKDYCFLLAFISHSSSLLQLRFIFEVALPRLLNRPDNKCLVDVGCRLGAVLYGVSTFYQCFLETLPSTHSKYCQLTISLNLLKDSETFLQIVLLIVCHFLSKQSSIAKAISVCIHHLIVLQILFNFSIVSFIFCFLTGVSF